MIQKDDVPKFLKKRKIIEVHASQMVYGTKYRGTLEERFEALMTYVRNNNAILFIDEIHTIYGAGSTIESNLDIAEMLKFAIDRYKIKVIGATTPEEYSKFFASDALKRRFKLIQINEPNNVLLYEIIIQTLNNYSKSYGILIDNLDTRIIDILIKLTCDKYRNYADKVCNPDLVVGIIDEAFGRAYAMESIYLTTNDIIVAIENETRIYDSAKEKAISEITNLTQSQESKSKSRVLKLY